MKRRSFFATLLAPLPLFAKDTSALLAQDYKAGIDPSLYLVSEKLDGVRALWDGKSLKFRSGQAIAAPRGSQASCPPRRWMVSYGSREGSLMSYRGPCASCKRWMPNGSV